MKLAATDHCRGLAYLCSLGILTKAAIERLVFVSHFAQQRRSGKAWAALIGKLCATDIARSGYTFDPDEATGVVPPA